MKDTKSWLLVLLSFCIVGTWVYHLYDKREYNKHQKIVYVVKDPVRQTGRDSLPERDTASRGKDTSNKGMEARLEGIISLRNEIAAVLADSNIATKDLYKAEEKIRILKQNITALSTQTDLLMKEIAKEKESEIIKEKQTRNEKKSPAIPPDPPAIKKEILQGVPKITDPGKKDPQPAINPDATFKASQVSLKGLNLYEADKTLLTTQAKQTNYLGVSFLLTNNTISFNNTPVYIVLIDPLGDIIQDDLWEAGIINTPNDGIMRYTRKINIEYTKGESRKVDLSIQLPKFSPGNYKLQLYHNSQRIGKADLVLH